MLPLGTRVRRADADKNSIPAYRAMRGIVIEAHTHGCRVHWIGDPEPDWGFRPWSDVVRADDVGNAR